MATEYQGSARKRSRWRSWLQVAGLAAALLAVSEAIWLWQTWPLRDLLEPAPPLAQRAGR